MFRWNRAMFENQLVLVTFNDFMTTLNQTTWRSTLGDNGLIRCQGSDSEVRQREPSSSPSRRKSKKSLSLFKVPVMFSQRFVHVCNMFFQNQRTNVLKGFQFLHFVPGLDFWKIFERNHSSAQYVFFFLCVCFCVFSSVFIVYSVQCIYDLDVTWSSGLETGFELGD